MKNRLFQSLNSIVLIALIAGLFVLPDFVRAGLIISWGSDGDGQVSNTPTESNFTAVAAGVYHSLALTDDGSIVSWGKDDRGQVSNTPTENGFTAIAGGSLHSLALGADGTIVSWGWDDDGQVRDTPTESGFTAIAGGGNHSLALGADGTVVSWGRDDDGQVSDTPTENGFTAIAGGGNHSLALKADGTIVSWGRNEYDQVSTTPTENGFTAIAAGGYHSLALKADGTIVSWGRDSEGQVSDTPVENGFTAIAGGGNHSLILKANGSIVSWGWDDYGQISDTPTENGFTAIAAGCYHSLALSSTILLMLEPNGNERLKEGSHYELRWDATPVGIEVLIEYSFNNGSDWHAITTIHDANSYDWQVPGPASKDCLVRITDTAFSSVSDTSDDTFLIYTCDKELVGDFNQDCRVDLLDFALITQNWLIQSYAIYYLPLNAACDWTTDGQWQFGQPTGNGGTELGYPDPDNGYTGSSVYGVNLNGDYTGDMGGVYCLTAGPFDCSGFEEMILRFARWLNTDSSSYVQNKVQVSNDGTDWHTVWESTSEVTDSSWQIVEYDVGETADNQPTVYFRWSYEILDSRAYLCSGWNIDDIELLGRP